MSEASPSMFRAISIRESAAYSSFAPTCLILATVSFAWQIVADRTALALDAGKAITQYRHNVWRTADGLPQDSVFAVLQTHDGYLWLGTEEGLARFDGARFTVYDTTNTPALRNNHVTSLVEDRRGVLWIGTLGGGLTSLERGHFATYTKDDGLLNNVIRALCADRNGAVWIGTDDGLNRLSDGSFMAYTIAEGLPTSVVWSLFADHEGSIWLGTRGAGVSRLKDGRFTTYTTQDGLSNDTAVSFCEDREGNIWIGTPGGGLNKLRDGELTVYTTEQGLSNDAVRCIVEDQDGNLWVGTRGGGVGRFSGGRFSAYGAKDGMTSDFVLSLAVDYEGSLWIGTQSGGLNRLSDGKFTTYTTREGLSSDVVRCVYEDRDGSMWFGTQAGGLNRFNNGAFKTYTTRDGLSSDVVFSIVQDRDGSLWIGTPSGLNRFKQGELTVYGTKDGLPDDLVYAIYEDHSGALWIGTQRGLSVLKGGTFTNFTIRDGLSNDVVWSITEDRDHNLWFGTLDGLTRMTGSKMTSYAARDGLASSVVRALYADDDGSLWIGTSGGGLSRMRDGKFTSYTTKVGLFNNVVLRVLDDGHGNLWMSCNKGIFRVSKKELNEFAEGKLRSIHSTAYGVADGMRSAECNGGNQPAGWKAHDGTLWFPTIMGVVAIDPSRIRTNPVPPPTIIEEAIIDAQSYDPKQALRVPPGEGRIEFHYTGLSLLVPTKVLFRYRLDGFDEDWIDAGPRRVAYYTNIRPGDYQFRVEACNNDGLWSRTSATCTFTITAPLWMRSWFVALVVASVLGGVYSIGRTRQQVRHRRELERMELVRSLTVGIFHELRQPLQVLQSQLEILQLHSDRGKFEVKHVQEALTGLERLKVMIEKVENLHRSERLRMMSYAGEDKMVDLRPEEPK